MGFDSPTALRAPVGASDHRPELWALTAHDQRDHRRDRGETAGLVSFSRSRCLDHGLGCGLARGETRGGSTREHRRPCRVVKESGGTPPPLPRLPRGRPMAGGVLVEIGVGEHDVADVEPAPVGLAHLVGDAVEVGALVVIVIVER